MKTNATLYRFLLLCTSILLLTTASLADTIRLKNGSVIKGKVTTFNDHEFTILLDLGSSGRSTSRMIVAAEDIQSIEFDGVALDSSAGRVATNPVNVADQPVERPTVREVSTKIPAKSEPLRENTQPISAESASAPSSLVAEKTVKVISAADWTSTEIRIRKGQRVTISASGEVDLGNGRMSTPEGLKTSDSRKLLTDKPTGALIAVIGDDNDDFVYVGRDNEFTATHDGILFLSVNEGNLKD
ncbi:MAG TPA: hypothetical protein VEF04_01780, partial [Blastocatellia bacterium]|nr:hypothetical protein [Blastocatellia bacterium]